MEKQRLECPFRNHVHTVRDKVALKLQMDAVKIGGAERETGQREKCWGIELPFDSPPHSCAQGMCLTHPTLCYGFAATFGFPFS